MVLVISACQPAGTPTASAEEIAQSVAYTQQARATQNSIETLVALVTQLSQPTNTPAPTSTPVPAPTQTLSAATSATVAPTDTPPSSGPKCYQMSFLDDVNYAPGTVVSPGQTFTKIWRVENTGTCEWDTVFDLLLVGGDPLGTNRRGDIKTVVKPGDYAELSIEMTAPLTPGTYYSYWMITDNKGARFGYGPNSEWSLGVQIEVK